MNNDQIKGKRIIQIIFCIFIILEIIIVFMTLIALGPTRFFTALVRGCFSLGLFYCIFKKKNWARIVTSLLFLIAGLSSILNGVTGAYTTLIVLGTTYSIVGVILLASKDVKAYMQI